MDIVQGSVDVELPIRVSARGVIAGILVGLALAALLMALGAAIAVTSFGRVNSHASGIFIGAWFLVTFAASAFGGSWLAAGAARALRRRDGVLHGIVTWAAMLLLATPMVSTIMRDIVRSGLAGDPSLAKLAAWGAFVVPAVALVAAIVGGLVGVARERRVAGLASGRAARRRPVLTSPQHTGDAPPLRPHAPQT